MPAIRGHRSDKKKEYTCDYEGCHKTFTRPYDLQRHRRTHCGYDDREFGCKYPGCNFRANQLAGLKCHINSIHKGVRLPCDHPGCEKTFSDPSSRSKHKQKFHSQASEPDNTVDVENAAAEADSEHPLDAQIQPRKHIAPYMVPVHISVARHVEQHSRNDVKDILSQFATFALTNEEISSAPTAANPFQSEPLLEAASSSAASSSVSRSVSSEPSSSAHSSSSSLPSTPCELPGVLQFTCSVNDWQTPLRGRFDADFLADFLLNSAQLYLGNPLENQQVEFGVTPTPSEAHDLAELCQLESYASSGAESSTFTMPFLPSDFGMPNHAQANYTNYADSSFSTVPNPYIAPAGQIPDKVAVSVPSLFQAAGYEENMEQWNMEQWNNVPYFTPGVEYLGFPHVNHWQTGNFTHL